MTLPDTSIDKRLKNSARLEFLEFGYDGASIYRICENAGVTTGALYKRYSGKKNLFKEIVRKSLDGFINLLNGYLDKFFIESEDEFNEYKDYSNDGFKILIDYIYENIEIFDLVINRGENSVFEEFLEEVVEIEIEGTFKFIEDTNNDAIKSGRLNRDLAYILLSALYSGFFKIIKISKSKEQASIEIQRLRKFYHAGWDMIFKGGMDEIKN